jgi:hypothetical protein
MNLKFLKLKTKFKKREHQPNPDFYWKIVLSITSIFIFSALGFGIHLFLAINDQDFSSASDYQGQAQKISEDRIKKVLDYYETRALKSKQIVNSPSPIADPSI